MTTPQLTLPEIAENQALKYLTHNSALRIIDALLPRVVQSKALTIPPDHDPGAVYIVAENSGGEWQDQDHALACSINDAWVFVQPRQDWRVFISDEQREYRFDRRQWITHLPVQPVSEPSDPVKDI